MILPPNFALHMFFFVLLTLIIVILSHITIRIYYRQPVGNQIFAGVYVVRYTPFLWISRTD